MSESARDMFKKCSGSLRAMRPALLAKQEAALAEAAAAGELLKQLDAAVDLLEGNPVKRRPGRKKGTESVKGSNCSTKEEILELLVGALRSIGPSPAETLKDEVAMRLREQGRSLSGFARIFSICLSDDSIVESRPGVYSLTAQTRTAQQSDAVRTLN